MRYSQFEGNWKLWLKSIGLIFLFAYLWLNPIHLELIWVAAYLALALGVGAAFALIVNPILERLLPSQKIEPQPYGDQRFAEAKRRPFIEAVLVTGEDGFFFVPLLLIGVTPIAAVVCASAYAAIHYPEFPIKHCVVKAVILFLIAMWILPHGIATIVVGHLLLDTMGYIFWRQTQSAIGRHDES